MKQDLNLAEEILIFVIVLFHFFSNFPKTEFYFRTC